MAAAFPFTVSTTGRLVFLSCFMKSPDRRRNVVRDWMSLVISSMEPLLGESTFLGATRVACPRKEHDDRTDRTAQWSPWHDVAIRVTACKTALADFGGVVSKKSSGAVGR